MSAKPDLLAAGTVCWRRVPMPEGGEQLMVLVIHRTKQRDVTFPKGKLDPGETMPQTAVRETEEETGLRVALGVNLGTINYALPSGRRKTVQYWAAEVTPELALASTFTPNREVQALEWVPAEQVRDYLTYNADRELYDVFQRLVGHDLLETFSIVLLRHAKARPRGGDFPLDRDRPLTETGVEQAQTRAAILTAFGPERIKASTATRCRATVAPLAEHLGLKVKAKRAFSQDAWDAGELPLLREAAGKLISKRRSAVVCTHLPVLPDLARELVLATGSVPGSYLDAASAMPPAGFSVFHFSRLRPGAGILGVETYPLK